MKKRHAHIHRLKQQEIQRNGIVDRKQQNGQFVCFFLRLECRWEERREREKKRV